MKNELIQELAKRAHEDVRSDEEANGVCFKDYDRQFQKAFAQLIIQACSKHITDQQDLVETNWQCKDGIHIVYSLKEHFGVEE
jgi:hypothetical protein